MLDISINNIDEWIENNKQDFKPPVCNKCMFDDQLMVFFIGGPNVRQDFHLEEGEEFFCQLKGDMCLQVVENGKFRDVHIKEGQVVLMPARIQHSPQRFEGTVGFVVERRRAPEEKDCLRYFVPDSASEILFERWTHVKDIVKDLPPIIKSFMDSEPRKLQKPTPESILHPPPFCPDPTATVPTPIRLETWLDENWREIQSKGMKQLFGPPNFRSSVILFGAGSHDLETGSACLFVWQIRGTAEIRKIDADDSPTLLTENFAAKIGANSKFALKIQPESACLAVSMPSP